MTDSARAVAEESPSRAHILSVDVEAYFQAPLYRSLLIPAEWESFPDRVDSSVSRLLSILGAYRSRATFFLSQWVMERHPDLVARITDEGHEAALLWINGTGKTGPDEFLRRLRSLKNLLEGLTSYPVVGFRARQCCLPHREEWLYDALARLGFSYDASVCPRGCRGNGDGAQRWPHTVEREDGELIVLPRAAVSPLGFSMKVASGRSLRQLPYWVTESALDAYSQEGQPATISLRSWEVDPYQPTIGGAGWKEIVHRAGLRRTVPVLERLLSDFPVSSAARVLALNDRESSRRRRSARS